MKKIDRHLFFWLGIYDFNATVNGSISEYSGHKNFFRHFGEDM